MHQNGVPGVPMLFAIQKHDRNLSVVVYASFRSISRRLNEVVHLNAVSSAASMVAIESGENGRVSAVPYLSSPNSAYTHSAAASSDRLSTTAFSGSRNSFTW